MTKNTQKSRPAQPRPLTKKRVEPKQINARPTQRKSYHEEVSSGRLRGRKAEILNLLRDRPSISCGEAARQLGTYPNCLTAAFKQLEAGGILSVRHEKTDEVTGKRTMLYCLNRGDDE